MKKLYRYTANGEGIFSIGKRLLPQELVDEVNEHRKWLHKPNLPQGNYRFYLTEKGKEKYEQTLLRSHKKYLTDIKQEVIEMNSIRNIVYEDEYQIVEEV